jgi:hypothetical protein
LDYWGIRGLTTIRDSQDRHPVVQGGVYVTTKKITEQAVNTYYRKGNWAVLDIDRLPLRPLQLFRPEGLRDNERRTIKQALKRRTPLSYKIAHTT